MASRRLARAFFERPADDVARDLLGCILVVDDGAARRRARLVETEAYGGVDDPASHAHRGPTPRSRIMFGPAGVLYVYLVYGMHWCANVVTGREGEPSAVLLRAGELGGDHPGSAPAAASGPGRLTRAVGLTGADNGLDLCATPPARAVLLAREGDEDRVVGRSTRIGLTAGRERASRYFWVGHPAVSARPR